MKIIDMHCHIYPDKIAKKAIENIGNFYHHNMKNLDGTASTLKKVGKEIGIEKFIVHSTATKPNQVQSINDYIIGEINHNSEFVGYMTLHPLMTREEIRAEVNRVIPLGIKGVKLHPDFQKFNIDGDEFETIFQEIDNRLPFLVHVGDERYDYSRPYRLARMADKYPSTTFIAAHCGGYQRWSEVDIYYRLDNVHFDTSSSVFRLGKEKTFEVINKLGVDKCMFGSDYPMWNPIEEVQYIKDMNFSKEEIDMLLYKNACKFLERF